MREPAFTMRTNTVPAAGAVAGDAANSEVAGWVLSNATPLIR